MLSPTTLETVGCRHIAAGTRVRTAAGHNAPRCRPCDDYDVRRKVLIVDDHEDFRRSATALLAAEGFDVVGTVADGSAVVEAVERLRPEVVLLDIQLPDLDGFAGRRATGADERPAPCRADLESRRGVLRLAHR